jgi:hypothetical protein
MPPPSAPAPSPSFDEPPPIAAPAAPAEQARPTRASEGLFEEKRPMPPEALRDKDEDDETDHFKIGPVVGIGAPSVIAFGGTMKLTRFLGAGANIGLIPKVQLSYYGDATLSYQHYDIYGRIYPVGGGFFLQGGAGYATVEGTLKKTFDTASAGLPPGLGLPASVSYESRGSVRTLMLTALIGYFYTTKIGFSFGIDAGAQIPIAPSQIEFASDPIPGVPREVTDPVTGPLDASVRDTLESIGRSVLPTVNLRIGWIL